MRTALAFLFGMLVGALLLWWVAWPAAGPERTAVPAPAATDAPAAYPEIHSRHFLFGYPAGAPATNDLIVREAYALSSNDATKLADWVAYRLDRASVTGDAEQSRRWRPDPWLDEAETLEPADFRGAHAQLNVDRGHQAPLASFQGTDDWEATNYLSNITPQRSDLNQGPWRILEDRIRDLTGSYEAVYVMTGPLYEREMPSLPGADEPHRVPSGYWKIVAAPAGDEPGELATAAFLFDQDTPRSADLLDHLVAVDEVERRAGLDVLWALPDDVERRIEAAPNASWARERLGS